MSEGNEEEATEHIENALGASAKSGLLRHILLLEAAWISARVSSNAEQARTWVARAEKVRKPESRDSIDGAIALCEGRIKTPLLTKRR